MTSQLLALIESETKIIGKPVDLFTKPVDWGRGAEVLTDALIGLPPANSQVSRSRRMNSARDSPSTRSRLLVRTASVESHVSTSRGPVIRSTSPQNDQDALAQRVCGADEQPAAATERSLDCGARRSDCFKQRSLRGGKAMRHERPVAGSTLQARTTCGGPTTILTNRR